MLGKSTPTLGLVLVAIIAFVLVMVPVSVTVASTAAGGASGGIYNWYTLAPGEPAEWVLHYPGNNAPALVGFGVDPANTIEVKVYDDWQWRAVGAGDRTVVPIGRGTQGTIEKWDTNNEIRKAGNLFWEAKSKVPVVYHIQVINTSQQPARYWIAQTGPGSGELVAVSPLTLAYPARPQPTPTAQTSVQQKAQAQPPVSGAEGQPPLVLPVTGGPERASYFRGELRAE